VVESTGFEIRRSALRYRGFESHSLRQNLINSLICLYIKSNQRVRRVDCYTQLFPLNFWSSEHEPSSSRITRQSFSYRRKIPLDLLAAYSGRVKIRHSLRTRDKAEAIRLARLRSVELDDEFQNQRRKRAQLHPQPLPAVAMDLNDENIRRLCLLWTRTALETDDTNRFSGFELINGLFVFLLSIVRSFIAPSIRRPPQAGEGFRGFSPSR
jgi:hypothetical protein